MKKVVVIGSGIGGIGLAALLKKGGDFDVTVLERNSFIGGKAAAYERDGFKCDMGVHYCALGDHGPLKELARLIGTDITFIQKNPFMRFHYGDQVYNFSPSFNSLLSMIRMSRMTEYKFREIPGGMKLFRIIRSIKGEKEAEPYDDITLRDFLSQYITNERMMIFLEIFCAMLLVISAGEASAGEFLYCFGGMANAGGLSYPKGAFMAIPAAYRDVFVANGGKVLLKEPVTAICAENGRVTGVKTKDRFFEADIVVSNAGIQKTVELAGEKNFPADYVSRVKKLRNSGGAVTLKYALDKVPYDIPLYMYTPIVNSIGENIERMERGELPADDPSMFMPITTSSDPELAPPGKHILIAGSWMPAGLAHKDLGDKILDRMEKKISQIFPGIDKHVLWKHRTNLDYVNQMGGRGSGEVIGLAQSCDQVGKNKPKVQTPIEGLWLVGCDAGGRGVGTEQAAHSAINVSRMIIEKEKREGGR